MRGVNRNTVTNAVRHRAERLGDNLERFREAKLISLDQTAPRVETDLPRELSDAIADSRDYRPPHLPEPGITKEPHPLPVAQPRRPAELDLPVSIQFQMPSSADSRTWASRRRLKVIP